MLDIFNVDSIQKKAQEIILRNEIETHQLFRGLLNDSFNSSEIESIGLEIFQVVLVFPRFLSAMITRIEDYKLRMDLVENLFEEHGRMKIEKVHSETYINFLKKIGLNEQTILNSRPNLPAIVYTRGILNLCLHENILEGLAALAVIEEIVARVSITTGKFARKFSAQEKGHVDHFSDHEVLDLAHSREIYQIVAHYAESQKDRVSKQELERSILLGLELGCYYQKSLYTDIISK